MSDPAISLRDLQRIIKSSAAGDGYTAGLLAKGPTTIGRKVQEEAVEVLLASEEKDIPGLVGELSDLFYHALVLAHYHGIDLSDVERHLGREHKKKQAVAFDLERLAPFEDKKPPARLRTLRARHGIVVPKSADVVLLSPALASEKAADRNRLRFFTRTARDLVRDLAGQEQKVKLAVPSGGNAEYRSRRGDAFVFPVMVILNPVALPLCLDRVAASLKDALDNLATEKHGPETELCFAVKVPGRRAETWYRIKGPPQEVYRHVRRLAAR